MKKPSQLVNEPDLEPKTLRDCVKNVIYSTGFAERAWPFLTSPGMTTGRQHLSELSRIIHEIFHPNTLALFAPFLHLF